MELLSFLLRRFKPRGNKRKNKSRLRARPVSRPVYRTDWQYIGGYSYTKSDMRRVPRWVRRAMTDMDLSTAAIEREFFELRGKVYRYRVFASGQGATNVNIYRRRRRGR